MNWTEPAPPGRTSNYNHVICKTPIGDAVIEWKGWKTNDSYTLHIDSDFICEGTTLDEAKDMAKDYLTDKYNELGSFLNMNRNYNTQRVRHTSYSSIFAASAPREIMLKAFQSADGAIKNHQQ
jgi:hypothetical protein